MTEDVLHRCAAAVVTHWHAYGPRHGFASVVADLERALKEAARHDPAAMRWTLGYEPPKVGEDEP